MALLLLTSCSFEHGRLPASDASATGDGAATDASVDAVDAGDAAACPPGYAPNAFGTQYRVVTTLRTWQQAEMDCEATGAHLVVVNDASEDAALPTATEHWMGYSETVTQGTFLWVTGAGASSYTRWASLEPDVLVGAYCAVTRPDAWHDDNCSEAKAYICECDGRAADPTSWQ